MYYFALWSLTSTIFPLQLLTWMWSLWTIRCEGIWTPWWRKNRKVNMKNKNAYQSWNKSLFAKQVITWLAWKSWDYQDIFFPSGERDLWSNKAEIKQFRPQAFRATEHVLLNHPDVLFPFSCLLRFLHNIMGAEASLFMLHNAISFLGRVHKFVLLGWWCSQGVSPPPDSSLNSSRTTIPTTTGMPCIASAGCFSCCYWLESDICTICLG